MRFRTLEIRWHDSKPISTCDFQPAAFKKARPPAGQEQNYAGQSYRLATGGEDNHIRLWMVYPHILPPSLVESSTAPNGPRAPRVEYLATLSRHSAAVNVVRWSPNGDLIASAGDDGMIIIWAPSSSPQATTYGSDLSPEDLQHEKEYWKPRITFRCSQMQVYDLAWSPTGEYIIAGSTDNTARVFAAIDGKCVWEIAEHTHYVQGVAWDPLNEYVATQSSDRSMHIYRISTKNGNFEAHAIGKNTRMPHRHSRTPSAHGQNAGRPRLFHRESTSDVESAVADELPSLGGHHDAAPLTPAMSSASGPSSAMFPPPIEASSRRSSFSGSNAPGSPATFSRYARSPSPMPPLPAIRSLPPSSWSSVKLYGDESFTNFFRRLTFSPDGGLLLTPAGQFEDPSNIASASKSSGRDDTGTPPSRGRKGRPSTSYDGPSSSGSGGSTAGASSVFIYSRANFARPPIAQLPGHKKATVGVRFSPILYELRPSVEGGQEPETKTAALEKGLEGAMEVDLVGPVASTGAEFHMAGPLATPQRTPQVLPTTIAAPAPKLAISTNTSGNVLTDVAKASPALSPMDLRPPTPAASKPPTPAPSMGTPQHHHRHSHSHSHSHSPQTGSMFALPYRMLYSVITKDSVCIYDTQQASPVALLTKLHYDEFTDMTWSPDGQTLILSSRDGYCTIVIFDDILPAHHTQQHALQMQSIAHHNFVPLLPSSSTSSTPSHHHREHSISQSQGGVTPAATPSSGSVGLPPYAVSSQVPKKRTEPPLTPAASVDGSTEPSFFSATPSSSGAPAASGSVQAAEGDASGDKPDTVQEPPKKKRRVALTRVGDIGQ
ncbi:chromatin assembly complex protein [Ephemerocybe angulata]|uniref:Chromatin assembly complex protein n=1 Tax=Ephemerocybe angulata TaxID=980116 RepID=A0A8H6LVZ9_9AGAR|nr:chromatin assembly complex protein [Tulosesus angulatus]